jgi:hypothetical protein
VSPKDEPLVVVAELPWEEAWLLAGRLQADGIAARVFPETTTAPISEAQMLAIGKEMAGEIGLGRHFFQVLVPQRRAKEAGQIWKKISRSRSARWK